jgi:hypothetical protein
MGFIETPCERQLLADRNNARIRVFDADGTFIRDSQHRGTPCGLFMSADQHIWLAHGHAR